MADLNGIAVAAPVALGGVSRSNSGVNLGGGNADRGTLSRALPGIAVALSALAFKMRGRRTSNGATVHWTARGREDATGAQSPFPNDINAATVLRE